MTKSQIFILAVFMVFILLFCGFGSAAMAIVAFFTIYGLCFVAGYLLGWLIDKLP